MLIKGITPIFTMGDSELSFTEQTQIKLIVSLSKY